MQRPPVDVWVDVSPVYVAQVRQWQPGTVIRATIQSEVFTIEEKVQEMGWSKEGCEKMLQETGYSWDNALVKYYFEGKFGRSSATTLIMNGLEFRGQALSKR